MDLEASVQAAVARNEAPPPADMTSTERLERWMYDISRPIAFLGVIGMLIVSGITMYDVLARWLVSGGVPALNEVVSMTFAVAVTACIPCGLAQRVSLKVDLFEEFLVGRWRTWLAAIGDVLLVLFFALLTWRILIFAESLANQGRATIILVWPHAPFIYATGILLAFAVLVQVVITINAIREALGPINPRDIGKSTPLWVRLFVILVFVCCFALIAIGYYDFQILQKFAVNNTGVTIFLGCVLLWCVLLAMVPLAAVMGLMGIAGTALFIGWNPAYSAFATEATGFITNSQIAVLPLFLMMGSFCAVAGMANDIYSLAHAGLSNLRGGLAMATIGGCAGFGAVTGSSVATAATIGRVALPEMKARGYSPGLSLGCVAAGGTLGNLIPPGSGPLVLFALLTEASIGQLFIASLIPGLLAVGGYLVTIWLYTYFVPTAAPLAQRRAHGDLWKAARRCGPIGTLFVLVLGGMYAGIFTATELAAVGAFAAFLFALFRGKLKPAAFWSVMAETTSTTALVYSLVFGVLIFAFFTSVSGLTETVASFVANLGWPPLAVIALLLAVFLVLGTFMDSWAILIITVPIVTPLITGAGYDIIWWGVLNLFVVEIGAISPPFGLTMFVLKSIEDVPMATIFKGVTPFCISAVVVLAIITLFPKLATWLPSTMFGPG